MKTTKQTEPQIITMARLLEARERVKTIEVTFRIKADSFEAYMLEVAASHYTGGAVVDPDAAASMVSKMIVSDWLRQRVDFPTLDLSNAGYPLKRVNAELTKLE